MHLYSELFAAARHAQDSTAFIARVGKILRRRFPIKEIRTVPWKTTFKKKTRLTVRQKSELAAAAEICRMGLENIRLRSESVIDGLTGLYNRRHFDAQMSYEMEKTRRYHIPFSLLILDIDQFKSFNDTYGHQAGDEVLKLVAKVMRENTRKSDLVFRYGGEEFAILLPNTGKEGAAALAQRIQNHTNATIQTAERLRKKIGTCSITRRNREIPIRVSIGVSTYAGTEHTLPETDVVKRADEALYRAKKTGKDRTEVVGQGEKMNVLILDDEKEFCDMLENYFRRRGYDVVTTGSGEEAVRLLSERSFQMLLLDIRMPRMSGIDVLRKLGEKAQTLKIVVVSAVKDDLTKETAAGLGSCEYVEKPVSIEYLDKHLMARILDIHA